jgi:hypothetical protein
MEVQCDVDINNTKTQPAQIHFHPDIVLLCIIIKFIFLKESYHIYEEKSEIYLVWLKC